MHIQLAAIVLLISTAPNFARAGGSTGVSGPARCPCSCTTRGHWSIAESENFIIWSKRSQRETVELVGCCETFRAEISQKWFDEPIEPTWRPKCVVVVHADSLAYGRAIGNPNDQSVGCTTLTRDNGRILFRRIDLRSNARGWTRNALPHELTHVILADAFPEKSLPNWLNEGLAMTSEGEQLRAKRLDVLDLVHDAQSLPSLEHLLTDAGSSHTDANLHYACSLSLVQYLLSQGSEQQILQLARLATMTGDYGSALETAYQIQGGISALERQWRSYLSRAYLAKAAPTIDVPQTVEVQLID